MKTIDVDDELYHYIASHTMHIGESASEILRRMLNFTASPSTTVITAQQPAAHFESVAKPTVQVRAIRELLLSDEYAGQMRVVHRFMLVLSTLYQVAPQAFAAATESLQGRTRVYFATDQQILLQHGVHTKPRQIPNTPYWVITNTNSGRKRSMIEHIMTTLQLPTTLIEKVCATL